jgi:hypothetical protein
MLEICKVEGCEKHANRKGPQLCEMHYGRVRRSGGFDLIRKRRQGEWLHSNGYVLMSTDNHQLAYAGGVAYKHRIVFFSAHGDGPFSCHWCGTSVTWKTLHIDHLDDDKANNAVENLAASCPICNQRRGQHKVVATFRKRFGVTIDGVTKTLNEWAATYGISRQSIRWRLANGWEISDAIKTPRGKFGPKKNFA